MSASLPSYELYAIRYATRAAQRAEHFIGGDPHDAPMPMDYFTWLATGPAGTFVIDTGFNAATAAARKRSLLRCPVETLKHFGVAPESVRDVVQTHLHYDHVGNFDKFPNASFHLQEPEMAFATGRFMRHKALSHGYEVEHVVGMVRLNYQGRVQFHNGEVELAPGLTLHPTGGHTAGHQVVRVHTQRGWVVLASDASHFFENLRSRRPFSIAYHVGDMMDAFDTIERLAASPDHIVPGHDPAVMRLYPAPSAALKGIAVRLDVEPEVRERKEASTD
jgi:glyoxylase-like metal-dependent hydrolase (beta-lactamase superfamily II)